MELLEEAMERQQIIDKNTKIEKIECYVEMIKSRRRWGGLVSKETALNLEGLIVDSIGMLQVLSCGETKSVVDIGSGSGILGLVLAVMCPEWKVSMVESSGRKCAFLAEAKWAMEVENASVVRARAKSLVGAVQYDVAVSRAAGTISMIAPMALGLLRPGGRYVALKRRDIGSEVEDAGPVLSELGGEVVGIILPGAPPDWEAPGRTSLVAIEKM